eukprot:scaffold17306_cov18-Phaeocystis_antarctica.AAC.1
MEEILPLPLELYVGHYGFSSRAGIEQKCRSPPPVVRSASLRARAAAAAEPAGGSPTGRSPARGRARA